MTDGEFWRDQFNHMEECARQADFELTGANKYISELEGRIDKLELALEISKEETWVAQAEITRRGETIAELQKENTQLRETLVNHWKGLYI